MSGSMKEQGNGFFRQMNYKEAIKCYEQYVSQPHPDNKNAYCNLSLCHSKLAQHHLSIEACRKAIQLDPHYSKPYYRLVQSYRDLTGHPYEVLVNAVQYYRLATDQEDRQKQEMFAIIRHFRTLIRSKTSSHKFKEEESFRAFQQLRQRNESGQELSNFLDKYLMEWTNEWNSDVQSEDAKWEEIAYIMRYEDYDYGLNLAYFYLNRVENPAKKQQIKQSIRQIKVEMDRKTNLPPCEDFVEEEINLAQADCGSHILSEEERNKERERLKKKIMKSKQEAKALQDKKEQKNAETGRALSKKDMLMIKQSQKDQFGDSDEEDENEAELQQLPIPPTPLAPVEVAPSTSTPQIEQAIKQATKQSSTQEPTTIEETIKTSVPPVDPIPIQPNLPNPTSSPNPANPPYLASPPTTAAEPIDQTEQLYTKYCSNLTQPKNLMKQMFISVESILNDTQLPLSAKQSLLVHLKKKQPKLKVIVSAFTKKQKQVIYDLLVLNKIEEYAVDYVPDLYKK